jgi:hypothetical protein
MAAEPEQNTPEAPGTAGENTAGEDTAGENTAGVDAADVDTVDVDVADEDAAEAAVAEAAVAGADAAGVNAVEARAPGSVAATTPRAGVPVWRTGKPDAVLAAAVDVARAAVETIAAAEQIGRHLGARTEGDRLVTHLFESKLAGYGGWQWYAVLTRNSRSKVVTVDELGLLPSEDSILAPEWVPWAERVRPEDAQDEESADQDAQDEESAESVPAVAGQDADEPDVADADAVDTDAADADAVDTDAADADAVDTDAADAESAVTNAGQPDADLEHDDEEADVDGFAQPVLPDEEAD